MDSKKLDSYAVRAMIFGFDPNYVWPLSPEDKKKGVKPWVGGLPKGYCEKYLMAHYPQLKELWKGFKAKLSKQYDNLLTPDEVRDNKKPPTEGFLELDACHVMYHFDERGFDGAKAYLIKALQTFPINKQ